MEIKMVLHLPRDAVSVPICRQVLNGCLETLGVTPDTRADIALALSEACANVVRHAYPIGHGDVLCECEATDDEIVIRVSDWGVGWDRPSAQPGLGLGIPLIERLSDHATHSHSHGITLVEMRFARRGAAQSAAT